MSSPEPSALAPLRDQIGHLFSGGEHEVQAGHADLGDDIWLSTDPGGQGQITIRPGEEAGIVLALTQGNSGGWSCLGMRLPVAALAGARYLGLLIALHAGESLVSCTPTLRYNLHAGGHRDIPAGTPVLATGGDKEILSHIPVDHGLLEQARDCELNLFFHDDAFTAVVLRLEPLVIL